MLTIPRRKTKIGPEDHGRKMSLKDFEFVKTEEGYHFELSRGYITVSEVANYVHAMLVSMIHEALVRYKIEHPERIHMILGSMECKLLVPAFESERHPDLAAYLTKPKGPKNRTMWRRWIPELVIEVVSERSTDRDYVEKREDYWSLGVQEYWIVDDKRDHVVVLRRGKSDWIEKRLTPDSNLTTKLLPGFKLPLRPVFDAAKEAGIEEE